MTEPLIREGTAQRTSEFQSMPINQPSEDMPMSTVHTSEDTLMVYYNAPSSIIVNGDGEHDDDYPRYQVCLNDRIVGKPDKTDKSAFAHLSDAANWRVASLSFLELAQHIGNGYPFMPGLLNKEGRRKTENVAGFNILALDIDDGLSITDALNHHVIKEACGLGIESARSNTGGFGDRFRLIFALPRVVAVDEGIRLTLELMRLIPQSDRACKNPDRMYFGAPNREPFLLQPNAVLPEEWVTDILAKTKSKPVVKVEQSNVVFPPFDFTKDSDKEPQTATNKTTDIWAYLAKIPLEARFSACLSIIARTPEGIRRNTLNSLVFGTQYLWYKMPTIAEQAFIQAGQKSGLSLEESTKTVQDAMQDSLNTINEQPRPIQRYLLEFSQIMPTLRFNQRSLRLINEDGKDVDLYTEWAKYSIASELKPLSFGKFCEYIEAWCRTGSRPFDPVVERLTEIESNGLPSYDEAHEIIQGLATLFNANPQQLSRTMKMLAIWLVGAVKRGFEPGCVFDYVLVLHGAGGCGKTSFFEQLALDKTLLYHAPQMSNWEASTYQSMNSAHFVLFDEFDTYISRKSDISEMKSFISATQDTARFPYARAAVTMQRSCVLGGTTNSDTLPDDGAENRRYISIAMDDSVSGIDRVAYYQQHKGAIWAAAISLYRSGYPTQLSTADMAVENIAKLEFKETSDVYVIVSRLLERAEDEPELGFLCYTIFLLSDILSLYNWAFHPRSREGRAVVKALQDAGYLRITTRTRGQLVKAWSKLPNASQWLTKEQYETLLEHR